MWVLDALGCLYEHLCFAWVWLKATWRSRLGAHDDYHRPKIVNVFAFSDDGESYRDITREFHAETWERDVKALTGWTHYRVEIRYTMHKRKFRMLLRPGDTCKWPPPHEHAMKGPRGIFSATLSGKNGARRDVTKRLAKYCGPHGDFHQQIVHVHDCFPFDDCEYEAEVFETLRIIDHTLVPRNLSFVLNDLVHTRAADPHST